MMHEDIQPHADESDSQRSPQRIERVRTVLQHRQPDLTVVIENIHDPHNVSAMLRSCDAVGVMRVELVYSRERFPSIGKKSSSSAYKWVERRKHSSAEACYATLRSEGFAIYATSLDSASVPLYKLDLTGKVALVFGNEHRGVSEHVALLADRTFKIPMLGMIESLNVSVACAVTLYEALRQRLGRGDLHGPKFSDDQFQALLDEWLQR